MRADHVPSAIAITPRLGGGLNFARQNSALWTNGTVCCLLRLSLEGKERKEQNLTY